jgi:hypothetical protein
LRVKRDIRKLDDLDPSERLAAFLKMFPGSPDQPVRPGRSFLDILKGEDDDGDDDADLADHPIAELVRLLVAAGNKPEPRGAPPFTCGASAPHAHTQGSKG